MHDGLLSTQACVSFALSCAGCRLRLVRLTVLLKCLDVVLQPLKDASFG
jgi:hypothetical protein